MMKMGVRVMRQMLMLLLLCQLINAFSMLDKLASEYADDSENEESPINDYFEENRKISGVKRQSSGGTCTCTCETKPVSRKTDAAALMRTAIRPETAKAAAKTVVRGHALEKPPGILKAEPWDYGEGEGQRIGGKSDVTDETKTAESRFPWKALPDTMCYRSPCKTDSDCCMRYNLCDGSAFICYDCWHGSNCKSEADCCHRFPFCRRPKIAPVNGRNISGICVSEL